MGDGTVLALDVGGTGIKGAVLDSAAKVLAETEWLTFRERGPAAVVESVLDTLDELRLHPMARDTRAVGLAVPGIVDVRAGVAVWSENLGWHNVPFRELAAERTGLPVAFGHDVRVGGLAEARLGAAQNIANVLFLPIGTGIGAGIIVDGHVLEADGYVGEIGHIDVGHGEPCACGGSGCLEAVASAAAIARRYSEKAGRVVRGASEVTARVETGDQVAREVWDEAVDALARALAIATSLLAPEVIVVGGGLSLAGDSLLTPLADRLDARLTFQRRPRLLPAALGDRAACLGAGLLALEVA
jgi:glucokinase